MKKLFLFLIITVGASGMVHAQKDTVLVQGFYETSGTYGTLNTAIEAAVANGTINNTVFKLSPYEVYVLNRSIFMDVGQNLEIVAPKAGADQESAPPQIVWTEEDIERQYIIQTYGDLVLKNIWIRYADILGTRVSTSITFEDQPGDKQETGYFEGVIFDDAGIGSEGGGSVNIKATNFVGTFKDSYFRNNGDVHYRYYGRALSFPYQSEGWGIDYVLFENTTFAGMGYVYMQEGNQFGQNVHFNHCTFYNIVMFGLQSGWWNRMSVTNSVFVNPFMLGYAPFQEELENTAGGMVAGLTPVDSLGFDVNFTDHDREILITNNSYVYEPWLLDWMANNPYSTWLRQQRRGDEVPLPKPYINESTLSFIDSTDAGGNKIFPKMVVNQDKIWFGADANPSFVEPPIFMGGATALNDGQGGSTDRTGLKGFLISKWHDNAQVPWAYDPESGFNQIWPLPENMAYTNTMLQTASLGEFPLGDLNWYPEQKAEWEAQRSNEWQRIEGWMMSGADPGPVSIDERTPGIASGFMLQQNYPNPFNPTTQIRYVVPEASSITLKVYNTIGQEVATLFEGMRQAGSHVTTFNASGLSSGIYFYRLETADGAVSISRKLLLIK